MADDLDLRRRRLAFRTRHRGIKEMDLLLGRFADQALATMGADQLSQLESLAEVPDQDLFNWISGRQPVPPEHDNEVMAALKALTFNTTDYGDGRV